jgi:hypothetical protein
LVKHLISAKKMNYGCGVGDVNGDSRRRARPDLPGSKTSGREDVDRASLGAGRQGCATDHPPQILVFDVNGDKVPDVITSSAHKHGIFWYEQAGGRHRDVEAARD